MAEENKTANADNASSGTPSAAAPIAETSPKVEESEELDPKALADIEASLAEDDPEFANKMATMAKDSSIVNVVEDHVDIAVNSADVDKTFKGRVKHIMAFAKLIGRRIFEFILDLVHRIPSFLKYCKTKISAGMEIISEALRQFKYYPLPKKLTILGFIALCILTVSFIFFAVTRDILSPKDRMFQTSLEEIASAKYTYNSENETESFYESDRVAQNLLQVKKIVVNIQKSDGSGPNPMAAVEVMLEGTSPEVLIEFKIRESEMRDIMQRDLEEMTFTQMDTADGRRVFLEKLRRSLNRTLSDGKIRRIFITNFVIKP